MNTTHVSFERGKRVLEHQEELFQFSFCDLEIKKKNEIFHFFIIIASVIGCSENKVFSIIDHG